MRKKMKGKRIGRRKEKERRGGLDILKKLKSNYEDRNRKSEKRNRNFF